MSRRTRDAEAAAELAAVRHREITTKLAEVTDLLGHLARQQGDLGGKTDDLGRKLAEVQAAVTAPKPPARRRSSTAP